MKKLILLFTLIFCFAISASAWNPLIISSGTSSVALSTPTFEKQAHDDQSGGATLTVAFTPDAGSNRCFFGFEAVENETTTGVTFDGNAMNSEASLTADGESVSIWSWCDDSTSGAISVVFTHSGGSNSTGWVVQVDGAAKTGNFADINDTDTTDGTDGNPQTITNSVTTTLDNCLLLSGVMTKSPNTVIHSVCSGTGQTLLTDNEGPGNMQSGGGYFDLSSQGAKDQCFESDRTWANQLAVTIAVQPYGT
ncbi:MAG: hypothetical protein ACXADH_19115 [Candidatus Kariarchaeaceae archaeon]|jgi:hypothetical protein